MHFFYTLSIFLFFFISCGYPIKKESPNKPKEISLKVINYNLWHGLGTGFIEREALEPQGRRETRLVEQFSLFKSAQPDILFLQELNPVSSLSHVIAEELGMNYVYKITNCGISVFTAGIPVNLSMGIAILARPPLEISKILGLKLSGSPGFCKKYLSFQYGEFRYALFALAYHPDYGSFLLVNTHLHHGPEWSPQIRDQLSEWEQTGLLTSGQREELSTAIEKSNQRRKDELQNLFGQLSELQYHYQNLPVILAGDFNATPESSIYKQVLEEFQLKDTTKAYSVRPYTWNPEENEDNHTFSAKYGVEVPTFGKIEVEDFFRDYDRRHRRIDYIFISSEIKTNSYGLFAHEPNAQGIIGSDHFGVEVILNVSDSEDQ